MSRFILALLCAAGMASADDLASQMRSLIDAYVIAQDNAADPVTTDQAIYQGAIPGLLRVLDPHSVFFDPGQFDQLRKMQESTQKGFGSVVSLLPGRVIVLQTLPGTPAAKSGLAPGDEILAINGYIISRLETEQLEQLLTVSRQRPAQLQVLKPGSSRIVTYTMTPAELQTPSVERAFFIGAAVGYIRVSSFDEKTGHDLSDAIEKLGGERLAGLVLDLRDNPGGVVTSALETASLFLKPGQKIFTVRGRHVPEKTEVVSSLAKPYSFKLAVLINGKSASASEIVTGALQDHDRATVIGDVSYGKGLVQSVFPLSDGTGLALTTALYYTPSGRSIQKPLDASRFALGATTAHPNKQSEFHTDSGRKVTGGGGIQPDILAYPPEMDRLRSVLEASAAFTSFATAYLQTNTITPDFEVTPRVLDEFHLFLNQRGIQPAVPEWSQARPYITSRLKEELFTLAFGVEKGDEVHAQRDPAIQKALEIVGS
jgi:carboxyl-terminal processing protease